MQAHSVHATASMATTIEHWDANGAHFEPYEAAAWPQLYPLQSSVSAELRDKRGLT